MLSTRVPPQNERYTQTKSKEIGKVILCKCKKAGIAVLVSDKTDFKTKVIVRDKEGYYIMIKGPIQQEDITLINIYAPNIGAPKDIKQIFMNIRGEINSNTIIEILTPH